MFRPSVTVSLPALKTLRRKVVKGFQFLTFATRSPTESPLKKATLMALPPSSWKSSTSSGLVLPSEPISVKVCELPTLSRQAFEAVAWPGADAVARIRPAAASSSISGVRKRIMGVLLRALGDWETNS